MLTRGSCWLYSRGGGGTSQGPETVEKTQGANSLLKGVCLPEVRAFYDVQKTSDPDKIVVASVSKCLSNELLLSKTSSNGTDCRSKQLGMGRQAARKK